MKRIAIILITSLLFVCCGKDQYQPFCYPANSFKYIGRTITDDVKISKDSTISYMMYSFYDCGCMRRAVRVVNGKKEGKCVSFFESGSVLQISYYKDDLLNGDYLTYYENGKLEESGQCHLDKIVGITFNYDSLGRFESKSRFEENRKIYLETYLPSYYRDYFVRIYPRQHDDSDFRSIGFQLPYDSLYSLHFDLLYTKDTNSTPNIESFAKILRFDLPNTQNKMDTIYIKTTDTLNIRGKYWQLFQY